MTTISRRSALLGGAAALTTATTTVPLAIKAGAVKEALAGTNPTLAVLGGSIDDDPAVKAAMVYFRACEACEAC